MAFTIDNDAARKQMFYDPSKPQEQVPEVLPETWIGTASRGLPVKHIPHYEFPKCLYLHPVRPTITILHRNDAHEVVHKEEIATEALTQTIGCEAAQKLGCLKDCSACNELLKAALAEGWVLEPYIPAAVEKPNADLYGPKKKAAENLK